LNDENIALDAFGPCTEISIVNWGQEFRMISAALNNSNRWT